MSTNLERLELAAQRLGPLLDELTLVGGTAVGLLISDPAAEPPRPTLDVDFVAESTTYVQYAQVERRLMAQGFAHARGDGDPRCRFRLGDLVLDVMPLDERVLGFSNAWYRSGIKCRVTARLPSGTRFHHIDAPHLIATKLLAFAERGEDDVLTSHDIEDIVRTVDGRDSVVDELAGAPAEVRAFVAKGLERCVAAPHFLEALSGYFRDPELGAVRARGVELRLRQMIRTRQA